MSLQRKRIESIVEKGFYYNSIVSNYFIENYKSLKINNNLKDYITKSIKSNNNFEVSTEELKKFSPILYEWIDELLTHPDFDPFKEVLRAKFPLQYGSNPFIYKGKTYYLYDKGREFYIDSLITGTLWFIKLIDEHLKTDKSMKFSFRKWD